MTAMKKGHLSERNLKKVLERLVKEPRWGKAMAAIGASESLAFVWVAKSAAARKANDTASPFYLVWREQPGYWHEHCQRARYESIQVTEATVRERVLNGIETPVLNPSTQQPVYLIDEALAEYTDEELFDLLGRRNRYVLNADGSPKAVTKIEHVPAQVTLAVLRQDERFRERVELDVHHSGVIQTQALPARKPDEKRANVDELKRLALLPLEQRRAALAEKFGQVSPYPKTAKGLVTAADTGAPRIQVEAPDSASPERVTRALPRPSDALDQASLGRGIPPPGGFRVDNKRD